MKLKKVVWKHGFEVFRWPFIRPLLYSAIQRNDGFGGLNAAIDIGDQGDADVAFTGVTPFGIAGEKATVDEGVTMKRMRPAPQGRGYRIRKRSNHVTLFVDAKTNDEK